MFSSRLPTVLKRNAFTEAVERFRTAGTPLLDLTVTNPTDVGLTYPADLLETLTDSHGAVYQPAPFGLRSAREAVASDFARRGIRGSADRVVLTSSTSEAYALLFKLLCDPGDAVLVPQPSYPLFDMLTRLDVVVAHPYLLDDHACWSIDRDSLTRALSDRARAVLAVSPNNPTGSMIRAADREWLVTLCAQRNLAIIADEVFADYPLTPRPDAASLAGESRALTFSLGGLSKSAGLPQLKLAWMLVDGPDELVEPALERLELICDTYLSVSTPVQLAAPSLIAAGRDVRARIDARLRQNLELLRAGVSRHPAISFHEPEGGWTAVLRVPSTTSEERLVLQLLEDAHVIVHPGYFFDFPREAFLVISLLSRPEVLAEALDRLLPAVSGVNRS